MTGLFWYKTHHLQVLLLQIGLIAKTFAMGVAYYYGLQDEVRLSLTITSTVFRVRMGENTMLDAELGCLWNRNLRVIMVSSTAV